MKLFKIFKFFSFLLLIMTPIFLNTSCSLSPAGKLAGTWSAPFSIKMYYAIGGTEACGFPAVVEGTTQRNVTWTITSTGDNSVNIAETISETPTNVANSCNFPWTADGSGSNNYTGNISSSTLNISGMDYGGGQLSIPFTFTSSNLTATWNDQYQVASGTYQYIYSATKAFILTKH